MKIKVTHSESRTFVFISFSGKSSCYIGRPLWQINDLAVLSQRVINKQRYSISSSIPERQNYWLFQLLFVSKQFLSYKNYQQTLNKNLDEELLVPGRIKIATVRKSGLQVFPFFAEHKQSLKQTRKCRPLKSQRMFQRTKPKKLSKMR